jgi:hypothetical protein
MSESGQPERIGALFAVVIDVNDLETCAKFWSQVLGTDILFPILRREKDFLIFSQP